MPAIRVDWQSIRNDIETNGQSINSPFVFLLPHAGRHLLMSIIDTLKYQATYRIEDYDYADWDSLIALVEATHYGLMEGEQMGEISDAIRYLADKLSENFPDIGTNIEFPENTGAGESEDMAITLTQNVSCGCGCGASTGCGCGAGGADGTVPAPPTVPPVPITPPDPVLNPSDAQKCALSNYLVYTLRLMLLKSVEHAGNVTDYNSVFSSFFAFWSLVTGWVSGITYTAFMFIMQKLNGSTTAPLQVAETFDQHFNYYVCQLFSATSADNAYSALHSAIMGTMTDEGLRDSSLVIAQYLPYEILFQEANAIDIPVGFENGRKCCGSDFPPIATLPTPDPESGYILVPILDSEWSQVANNNSALVSYDSASKTFTHTPKGITLNYHQTDVSILCKTVSDRVGGIDPYGFVFQGIQEAGVDIKTVNLSTGTGGTKKMPIPPGAIIASYSNDEWANVPAFKAYIDDNFDVGETAQEYGNGTQTDTVKNGWRSESYGLTTGLGNVFSYRCWVIVKVQ